MSAQAVPLHPDWPNSASSHRVHAGGLTWHLQDLGSGPTMLLVHGAGAATHSWRVLAPLLGMRFRVIAPDLPGHGFSGMPSAADGFSLPAMARSLSALLQCLETDPVIAVGHSAGAAILARMALDRLLAPQVLICLNGALLPFSGLPGWLFAPLARLLARSDLIPCWVARRARDRAVIERLIENTGSHLDAEGVACYQLLAQRRSHVSGALQMMAQWDLQTLAHDLPRLQVPLVLFGAEGDRTIPVRQMARVKELLPDARLISLGSLGHLAHEEDPNLTAQLIVRTAAQAGVLPGCA